MSNKYLCLSAIILSLFVSLAHPLPRNNKTKRSAQSAWSSTGSMAFDRNSHKATVLNDSKVLVTGGWGGEDLISQKKYEVYDSSTGNWINAAEINFRRLDHTAALLKNGKVLIAGGWYEDDTTEQYVIADAELYDPITNVWSVVDPMHDARAWHTASVLSNGMILVTGGTDVSGYALAKCELYQPSTGKWTTASSMHIPRVHHTATVLSNGKVLVAGGMGDWYNSFSSAELYDPTTRNWISSSNT